MSSVYYFSLKIVYVLRQQKYFVIKNTLLIICTNIKLHKTHLVLDLANPGIKRVDDFPSHEGDVDVGVDDEVQKRMVSLEVHGVIPV